MRRERIDRQQAKGWWVGPWNTALDIAVGWANEGIDWPHQHERMTEIYLVASGTATARVGKETVELSASDMLIVEPGEAHTFLANSEDYRRFVIHTPALPLEEARADHASVPRTRLGLT